MNKNSLLNRASLCLEPLEDRNLMSIYLKLDGLLGEGKGQPQHTDWIEIQNFQFGTSSTGTTNTPAPIGASLQQLHLTPKGASAVTADHLKFTFTDVFFSAFATGVGSMSDDPIENFSLNFVNFDIHYARGTKTAPVTQLTTTDPDAFWLTLGTGTQGTTSTSPLLSPSGNHRGFSEIVVADSTGAEAIAIHGEINFSQVVKKGNEIKLRPAAGDNGDFKYQYGTVYSVTRDTDPPNTVTKTPIGDVKETTDLQSGYVTLDITYTAGDEKGTQYKFQKNNKDKVIKVTKTDANGNTTTWTLNDNGQWEMTANGQTEKVSASSVPQPPPVVK